MEAEYEAAVRDMERAREEGQATGRLRAGAHGLGRVMYDYVLALVQVARYLAGGRMNDGSCMHTSPAYGVTARLRCEPCD